MLDLWNDVSLRLFDFLLGWVLDLPRWAGIVVVGLLTAAIFTIARKWTTNQDRLRRSAADLRRLKELRAEAKLAGDKDALVRQNATGGRVRILRLKSEGRPLLVALLPLFLLGTWALHRLAYQSPTGDETLDVVVYLQESDGKPADSAEDDLLYLVPKTGLRALSGWGQPVRQQDNVPTWWDRAWAKITFSQAQPTHDMVAIWQLEADRRSDPYPLVFRWNDRTYSSELLIGERNYLEPVQVFPEEPFTVTIEVRLREARLFGIPGLGAWLPAWIVGYLLVTIPAVYVLKKSLRVF